MTGTLTGTLDGISPILTFTLPQYVALVTARATWTSSDPTTLVDLGLYDPSQTDKAESLASTSPGNAVVVANPMAGLWTLILGYGNPALPPADADYTVNVDYVAPDGDRRVHGVGHGRRARSWSHPAAPARSTSRSTCRPTPSPAT